MPLYLENEDDSDYELSVEDQVLELATTYSREISKFLEATKEGAVDVLYPDDLEELRTYLTKLRTLCDF
jgi:hypothetical protein